MTNTLADWSKLPKDIYVIEAVTHGDIAFDVKCCSVPMVMAPEVRYMRADHHEEAVDQAATFVLDHLAKALGLETWTIHDGSETWDGDVLASLYGILRSSGVLDPDTDRLATAKLTEAEATLKYCEEQWSQERGIMIDKIQVARKALGMVSAWDSATLGDFLPRNISKAISAILIVTRAEGSAS